MANKAVVANGGLEKARAYLNQVPWDRQLYIPSEGCGINFRWKHLKTTPPQFFAIVGLEPGTPGSVVQRFIHLATKQPPAHACTIGMSEP